KKFALRRPLQPSTVVGLGILAGSICYFVTRDPTCSAVAAAAVKILVSDNSPATGQMFEAIAILARTFGRPLPTLSQQGRDPSDQGSKAGSPDRKAPMTSDRSRMRGSLAGY